MMEWMRRRRPSPERAPEPDTDGSKTPRFVMSGPYLSLYTYLEKRYASRVVLTFKEIEDLLGFSLPVLARLSEGWWTDPDLRVERARPSDSWIMAHRTAQPNLAALTVVFDRTSSF